MIVLEEQSHAVTDVREAPLSELLAVWTRPVVEQLRAAVVGDGNPRDGPALHLNLFKLHGAMFNCHISPYQEPPVVCRRQRRCQNH